MIRFLIFNIETKKKNNHRFQKKMKWRFATKEIFHWFESVIRGGYNKGILRNTASCSDWSTNTYSNWESCGTCLDNFAEEFCPVVQYLYDTHDTSFTQCCLETCSSASTATTCTFGDPSITIQCGGLDISCLIALSSAQIYITGVGAVSQCPGV